MNKLTHNIIGWGAGLAIGMTIGVSLNNIVLGVGVGVAIGAGLATTQMKKEILQEKKNKTTFVEFLVSNPITFNRTYILYLIW